MVTSKWPRFSVQEVNEVNRVLLSGEVNAWTGTSVDEFERNWSDSFGFEYSAAFSNGTIALEAAMFALKIGSINGGHATDEVLVPCRSFVGTVLPIVRAGAIPVFCDIEPFSLNLCPDSVLKNLTPNSRAIMVVHIAGISALVSKLKEIADLKGLALIEDCSQAHGAKINETNLGRFGDVSCWSFCQDKIMTTAGEGGMVSCKDEDLSERVRSFRDHGKNFRILDQDLKQRFPSSFPLIHHFAGTNGRMTCIQAVVGSSQLQNLYEMLRLRKINAMLMTEKLMSSPYFEEYFTIPLPVVQDYEGVYSGQISYYKYYIILNKVSTNGLCQRQFVMRALDKLGVPVQFGSCCELHKEKAFSHLVCDRQFSNAEYYGERLIMVLIDHTLTREDILYQADSFISAIRQYAESL